MKSANKRIPLLICVLVVWQFRSAGAADWQLQIADPTGGGRYSSLRMDRFLNAHVAYFDDANKLLKYGFWDSKLDKWFTTTLDSSAGFCSLALDSKEHPHISYLDYGHGKLKYIHWNGSSWIKQAIDIKAREIDYYTSITLDDRDSPRISFYEYWGAGESYELHLRTVAWSADRWEVQTIDSTPGSGKFNSMGSGSNSLPQIAYANVKSENAGLRYAAWTGANWAISVLEGMSAPHPVYSVAMALDAKDTPHIAYTDLTNNTVKYAVLRGGKWVIEVVDSVAGAAYPDRNGIAIDVDGTPYMSYYDGGVGRLTLAHRTNGAWQREIVDENFNGFTSSLQVAQGNVWLTYSDETGQVLRFARRKNSTNAAAAGQSAALPGNKQ